MAQPTPALRRPEPADITVDVDVLDLPDLDAAEVAIYGLDRTALKAARSHPAIREALMAGPSTEGRQRIRFGIFRLGRRIAATHAAK
ncbi:hypothetical protein [Arthrobacter sp. NPDC089319]|uniref:hypothetical protein n=1 Tax=Arthrobacter sp. NPDC089319 TaxID=3155915 RepID=UPI00343A082E